MNLPPHLAASDITRYAAQVLTTGDEVACSIAPFTGEPLPAVPQSSAADVALAASRGRAAQVGWAAHPVSNGPASPCASASS
ncbi:MAG: hypothetical protein JWQ32_341 [Marmoricola sp.]|nr:hypothetical protein [Marmoricola sp.]